MINLVQIQVSVSDQDVTETGCHQMSPIQVGEEKILIDKKLNVYKSTKTFRINKWFPTVSKSKNQLIEYLFQVNIGYDIYRDFTLDPSI